MGSEYSHPQNLLGINVSFVIPSHVCITKQVDYLSELDVEAFDALT